MAGSNFSLSFMLLSPVRGRGGERGLRTSIPPLLTSPPNGGEELGALISYRREA
jgi:hypothetical protein